MFKLIENKDEIVCLYKKHHRLIMLAYFADNMDFNIAIFNAISRPNILSKKVKKTEWGFLTHHNQHIPTESQAISTFDHYVLDLMDDNTWWEDNED